MRIFIRTSLIQLQIFEGITDLEGKLLVSEPHVLRWHKPRKEDVDTFSDCEWHGNDSISCWLSVQAADEIRQIIEDGQIVLDHNDVVVMCLQVPDHGGALDSLLDVEVRSGLIEDVHIDFLDHDDQHRESLQLTT